MTDLEITPAGLAAFQKTATAYRLIDVREPHEIQIARFPGAEEIPMRAIPAALLSLEADGRELIVLCHHGVRSLRVVCWLREHGVENCRSLAGGIERWSLEIDPEIPRY